MPKIGRDPSPKAQDGRPVLTVVQWYDLLYGYWFVTEEELTPAYRKLYGTMYAAELADLKKYMERNHDPHRNNRRDEILRWAKKRGVAIDRSHYGLQVDAGEFFAANPDLDFRR